MDQEPVIYWLDRSWRIIGLNEAWQAFASANDGQGLEPEKVIGRPLWHFISGDATRMWLDTVLGRVRITQEPLERPYRCDCPGLKRFMKMRVIPKPGGVLRLEHHLVATEPRQPVYCTPYTPGTRGQQVLRCSLCGQIQHNGVWSEPGPSPDGSYLVVYTVCPSCAQAVGSAA